MNVRKSKKDDKEWLKISIALFFCEIIMIVLALFFEPETDAYLRANKALLIADIIVFFLFIKSFYKIKKIVVKIINNGISKNYTLSDYGDMVLVATYFVTILSLFLVLDLGFFNDMSVRVGIGAVVAINIISLLKNIFRSI